MTQHIMGNDCGPVAVAYYEQQCSHDFVFSGLSPVPEKAPTARCSGTPGTTTVGSLAPGAVGSPALPLRCRTVVLVVLAGAAGWLAWLLGWAVAT